MLNKTPSALTLNIKPDLFNTLGLNGMCSLYSALGEPWSRVPLPNSATLCTQFLWEQWENPTLQTLQQVFDCLLGEDPQEEMDDSMDWDDHDDLNCLQSQDDNCILETEVWTNSDDKQKASDWDKENWVEV
uniref:Uncharacterized protein n=1 Tax=Moniliophthora roreri TaxID=221103 RepID=A0A0W0FT80_MONRR